MAIPQAKPTAHCTFLCDDRAACRSRSAWRCLGSACRYTDHKDGKDGAELVTSAAASGSKQPYGNHHALQGQA